MPQRSDLSRRALKEAFARLLLTRPLAKISVREIVDEAGVARSTFYRNFEDREDFIDWLQADLVRETAARFVGGSLNEPDFTNFYRYAAANRPLMRAFLTEQHWPALENALRHQAQAHYVTLIRGSQARMPDDLLAAFLVGAHVSLFLQWLQSDPALPATQIADFHRQLGNRQILSLLK
ncbi:TetR/AcrR family transcriptional regulator [Lacticaseibacillus mingshuiensis]|uniref:TetR/AcrR family transcriptional regulator n=1 Tax=Lacticaseibacillus mingshuiensis TaxID=2799574 RepID=A0ABW4CFN1_9LACO|nr:TetR/AcrR family transcriptional regulator [Lacticaseibacillus mingshuiensis]